MSENKANVQPVLESFFTSALNKITNGKEQKMFSDLFVQVDSESGEVPVSYTHLTLPTIA